MEKEYLIKEINKLLNECDIALLKSVHKTLLNMRKYSKTRKKSDRQY